MNKKFNLLITGGTGSFGQAVLKRYLNNKHINQIKILSRDEEKQDALRRQVNSKKVKFYLGDVRNFNSIVDAIKDTDLLFHAAALKQVPSCEFFPIQAVETNILGTENVLNASIMHKVKKVVVLSTDKAVYPINAMGMSKGLMEKVMIAKSKIGGNKTIICGTRYGNVMASRGSVIPIIVNQIINNKKITVTDSSMTRFMMSLEDAVDLVEHAYKYAKPGDIFVQKSPSANMLSLAKALRNLFKSKLEIKFIGIRHGEKIYETLINKEEKEKCIETKKYFRIPADNRDLNYNGYLSHGNSTIKKEKEYTSHNAKIIEGKKLENMLMSLDFIKYNLKS